MNPIIRNILASIAGWIVGSLVNMGIISIQGNMLPFPEGYDMSNMDTMKETFHLLSNKHLIMPFFAHALGTLVGAYTVTKLAVSHHFKLSMLIGAFFMIGGIMMTTMVPSPMWFNALDIVCAYIPMAYLGYKFACK